MAVNSAIRLEKQGDLKMMFEGNLNHQQTCSMILARVQKFSADILMTRMYAKRWKNFRTLHLLQHTLQDGDDNYMKWNDVVVTRNLKMPAK